MKAANSALALGSGCRGGGRPSKVADLSSQTLTATPLFCRFAFRDSQSTQKAADLSWRLLRAQWYWVEAVASVPGVAPRGRRFYRQAGVSRHAVASESRRFIVPKSTICARRRQIMASFVKGVVMAEIHRQLALFGSEPLIRTAEAIPSPRERQRELDDRDRGTPRGAAPPTPPGIRVRTTAVRSG